MDIGTIVFAILGVIFVIGISMGLAKLSNRLSTRTIQKRFNKILNGKSKNSLKIGAQEYDLKSWVVEGQDGKQRILTLGNGKIDSNSYKSNSNKVQPNKQA